MLRPLVLLIPCVLLAAHHLRAGEVGAVAMWLNAPLLLLLRQRWVPAALQAALLGGAGTWVLTAVRLVGQRAQLGQPWLRLAAILGVVALGTALWALTLRGRGGTALWALGGELHRARQVFVVLVASGHAVFLAVARM